MCGALMKRFEATVVSTEYVGDDIVIISFTTNGAFTHEAGQYITVFFEGSSTPAGKAYSLSSAPREDLLSITVKNVGEFSGKLYALKQGDMFAMSEAYGHFNPHTNKPIVALSAGVGIAPVWSVLKDELARDGERVAHLFYSNKSHKAVAHHQALEAQLAAHCNLGVHHHITRAKSVPASMNAGRIDLDQVVKTIEGEVQYLICGSVEFVRDMWRGLVDRGVPQELVSTETFFE